MIEQTAPVKASSLGGAAVLAALPLGVQWSYLSGFAVGGGSILTNQYNPVTGDLDLVPQYLPSYFTAGSVVNGSQAPVRLLLVLASAAFVLAALRRTRNTRSIVRVGVVAVAAALALALAERARLCTVLLAASLALSLRPAGIDVCRLMGQRNSTSA